jgi:hypothetical protein
MSNIDEIISLFTELKCDENLLCQLNEVSEFLSNILTVSTMHVYGKKPVDAQITSHTSRLADDIAKMKESCTSYKCVQYDTIVTDALWMIQHVTEDVRKVRDYYCNGVCIGAHEPSDVSEKFWKNIMYIIADEDSQRFVTKIIANTLLDYYTAVYCIAYEISS